MELTPEMNEIQLHQSKAGKQSIDKWDNDM